MSLLSVPFGVGLSGESVPLVLEQMSALIAGLPGSGKSSDLRVIMAGLAHRDDVAIVGIDLKRVELTAWRPRLTALAVELDDTSRLLRQLVALVDARYALLEAEGRTRWDRTPDAPAVVVIVDELAEAVDSGEPGDKDRERLLRRLLSKGRAADVTLVLATQRPSADVIATSLRDLAQVRISHAQATAESTKMVFGASFESARAHELPIGRDGAGLAYVMGEGERRATLVRALWLPPEDVRGIATATAGNRPPLELDDDITDGIVPPARTWQPPTPAQTDADGLLLGLLAAGPQHVDALAATAGATVDATRKRLVRLEHAGRVTHATGSPVWSLVP